MTFFDEFFPTPIEVIEKMYNKLGINYGTQARILEPSAGKGDIIKYGRDKFRYLKFYALELNIDLLASLKGQAEVLGTDFLRYEYKAPIDYILMNPPFSNGVEHLLHAWHILPAGKIVCLLNKTNLENDFSQNRKLLKKLIEDHGEYEDLGKCFKEAERETNVEVVMITLEKPKNENFWEDNFERHFGNEYKSFKSFTETGVINQQDLIQDLISTADFVKKQIRIKAENDCLFYMNLKKLEQSAQAFADEERLTLHNGLEECTPGNINEYILKSVGSVNEICWRAFFEKSNLRSKVSNKVYNDFFQKYKDLNLDFTNDNIELVINAITEKQGQISKDIIQDTFDYFTRYHEDNRCYIEGWKTNSSWKVKERVIIPYFAEDSSQYEWNKGKIPRPHTGKSEFDKCFSLLMGGDPSKETGVVDFIYQCYQAGRLMPEKGPFIGETKYFEFKIYKKGTLHLKFKDKELLEKFNYFACMGRNWLPENEQKEYSKKYSWATGQVNLLT